MNAGVFYQYRVVRVPAIDYLLHSYPEYLALTQIILFLANQVDIIAEN